MKIKNVQTKSIMVFMVLFGLKNIGFGQRYKEKDDVIYLGKAEVGRVKGEPTFKTTLSIYGLKGEEVLTVKPNVFYSDNPFLEDVYWYTIRFSDTGKILTLHFYGLCKTKCILNNILSPKGINVDGGLIQGQDEIIRKHDISDRVSKDTTEIASKHKQMVALLVNNKILRGLDKPPVVFKESESAEGYSTTTIFSIAQDNIIIGKIIKTRQVSTASVQEDYIVYEKLYEPLGDITEVPACKVTSMFTNLEFRTTIDNKDHVILIRDRAQGIDVPKALGNYLVTKGYL